MKRAWLCSVALLAACNGPSVPVPTFTPSAAPTTTSTAPAVTPVPTTSVIAPRPIATSKPAAVRKATVAPKVIAARTKPAATYYANCTAARSAGAAPLHSGQAGYRAALDRDHDGVACE